MKVFNSSFSYLNNTYGKIGKRTKKGKGNPPRSIRTRKGKYLVRQKGILFILFIIKRDPSDLGTQI